MTSVAEVMPYFCDGSLIFNSVLLHLTFDITTMSLCKFEQTPVSCGFFHSIRSDKDNYYMNYLQHVVQAYKFARKCIHKMADICLLWTTLSVTHNLPPINREAMPILTSSTVPLNVKM